MSANGDLQCLISSIELCFSLVNYVILKSSHYIGVATLKIFCVLASVKYRKIPSESSLYVSEVYYLISIFPEKGDQRKTRVTYCTLIQTEHTKTPQLLVDQQKLAMRESLSAIYDIIWWKVAHYSDVSTTYLISRSNHKVHTVKFGIPVWLGQYCSSSP